MSVKNEMNRGKIVSFSLLMEQDGLQKPKRNNIFFLLCFVSQSAKHFSSLIPHHSFDPPNSDPPTASPGPANMKRGASGGLAKPASNCDESDQEWTITADGAVLGRPSFGDVNDVKDWLHLGPKHAIVDVTAVKGLKKFNVGRLELLNVIKIAWLDTSAHVHRCQENFMAVDNCTAEELSNLGGEKVTIATAASTLSPPLCAFFLVVFVFVFVC